SKIAIALAHALFAGTPAIPPSFAFGKSMTTFCGGVRTPGAPGICLTCPCGPMFDVEFVCVRPAPNDVGANARADPAATATSSGVRRMKLVQIHNSFMIQSPILPQLGSQLSTPENTTKSKIWRRILRGLSYFFHLTQL